MGCRNGRSQGGNCGIAQNSTVDYILVLATSKMARIGKRTMSVKSHKRGWEIVWMGSDWYYSDDLSLAERERPCVRCGQMPTEEGHDACLGHLNGVSSACCGHGINGCFVVQR